MRLLRSHALAALSVAGLVFVSACTSVLGNFDVATGGGASTVGGTGGGATVATSAGAGGGGGTMPAPTYGCTWVNPVPNVLATYTQGSGVSLSRVFLAERGQLGTAWVVAMESGSNDTKLVVRSSVPSATKLSIDGIVEVLRVARVSLNSTGILVHENAGNGPEIVLYELADEGEAPSVERHVILSANAWALNASKPTVSGTFVGTNLAKAAWEADVLVAYREASGGHVARFGHFTGAGGKTVSIIDPVDPLAVSGMRVGGMFHSTSAGRDFAYIGPSKEGTGSSEYSLGPETKGIVEPRSFGSLILLDAVERKEGVNLVLFGIDADNQSFRFHAGQVPLEKLGKWLDTDTKDLGTFSAGGKIPLGDPSFGWLGDMFVMMGGQGDASVSPNDYTQFGFYFVDPQGNERGAGLLPKLTFQPLTAFPRAGIRSVATSTKGGEVGSAPFTLHVAWDDRGESMAQESASALAYADVLCSEDAL